jgi:hypothetical protein
VSGPYRCSPNSGFPPESTELSAEFEAEPIGRGPAHTMQAHIIAQHHTQDTHPRESLSRLAHSTQIRAKLEAAAGGKDLQVGRCAT